jgi:hypothetical protein
MFGEPPCSHILRGYEIFAEVGYPYVLDGLLTDKTRKTLDLMHYFTHQYSESYQRDYLLYRLGEQRPNSPKSLLEMPTMLSQARLQSAEPFAHEAVAEQEAKQKPKAPERRDPATCTHPGHEQQNIEGGFVCKLCGEIEWRDWIPRAEDATKPMAEGSKVAQARQEATWATRPKPSFVPVQQPEE